LPTLWDIIVNNGINLPKSLLNFADNNPRRRPGFMDRVRQAPTYKLMAFVFLLGFILPMALVICTVLLLAAYDLARAALGG
jgi:hypothetical protein